MVIRIVAILIVGVVLMGYVPRVLATGSAAWVVWVAAAVVVIGGPRLLRSMARSAVGTLRQPRSQRSLDR